MSTAEAPPKLDLSKFETDKDKLTLAKQNLAAIVSEAKSYSVQEHGIKLVEEQHKALKKLDSSIEARRVELKKAPMEQCKLIDATAKELSSELAPAIEHLAEERKIHDQKEEARKAAAREAERKKVQDRINRLNAEKLPVDLLLVQTLSDAAFDQHVTEAAAFKAEEDARLKAENDAKEAARAEAMRKAKEELEAQQKAMAEAQAAHKAELDRMAKEREELAASQRAEQAKRDAEAEQARQQAAKERAAREAEVDRLRKLADEQSAEVNRLAYVERVRVQMEETAKEIARQEAEKAAWEAAAKAAELKKAPELEKVQTLKNLLENTMAEWMETHQPEWEQKAFELLADAMEELKAVV